MKALKSKIEAAKSDIQILSPQFFFSQPEACRRNAFVRAQPLLQSIIPKHFVLFAGPRPDTPHPNSHNDSAMLLKNNFFTKHVTPIPIFISP